VRHIVLEDGNTLDDKAVEALITERLQRSPRPLDRGQKRRVVVKLVAKNRRPRRPA
jgi:hypothetical protein